MKNFPEPIAITMGCPVGIGPEIIVRFFQRHALQPDFQPVVFGDLVRITQVAHLLETTMKPVRWQPGDLFERDTIPVLDLSSLSLDHLRWGKPTAETGQAMIGYIEKAVQLIRDGVFQAMVTCPITKTALKLAGSKYPGHTEMLASLSGAVKYKMMMAGPSLKVVLVTIHEPLRKVPELLSRDAVESCIRITAESLERDFGLRNPRIAVCGLNPHAGEGGMFGNEEEQVIAPAVRNCAGYHRVTGPFPPDTVFHRAVAGEFDAVVAMYHDQGLIPFKLLHFSDGVNVTLGLPIIRTSVDHGTAYDIAGKGIADPSSLLAAWDMACDIRRNRTNYQTKQYC